MSELNVFTSRSLNLQSVSWTAITCKEKMRVPVPASGGATLRQGARAVMRIVRKGCTNRPFYHIVITERYKDSYKQAVEQVGTFDPLPNKYNEKLGSFNYERIRYWIGEGVEISRSVQELLGLAGFLPIHPNSYIVAWGNRRKALEPEPPMPSKLTWRERKKILLDKALAAQKKGPILERVENEIIGGEGGIQQEKDSVSS